MQLAASVLTSRKISSYTQHHTRPWGLAQPLSSEHRHDRVAGGQVAQALSSERPPLPLVLRPLRFCRRFGYGQADAASQPWFYAP